MKTLIAKLEAATEGSRELDGEIALSLGWVKHHKGWAHWTTPEGLENRHVPFFSQSLDAALPGENIEEVALQFVAQVWKAGHIDRDTGQRTMGAGHTEALARRIAALKARQVMEKVT